MEVAFLEETEKTVQQSTPIISFEICTGVRELYQFLFNYSYTTAAGIVGLLISLGAGFWLITHLTTLSSNGIVFYLLVFLLYTVVNPLMLWIKARNQVKNNDNISKPIHYDLSDSGIVICSDEQQMQIEWKSVVKVKEFGNLFVVYVSKLNAFIWCKDQIGNESQVKKILMAHIDEQCLKLKR